MTSFRLRSASCPPLLAAVALATSSALAAAQSGESAAGHWPSGPDEPEFRGTGFASLRVPGTALRPRTTNVVQAVSSSGGCGYADSGSAFTVWNSAVTDLPHGAVINTVRLYYNDTVAATGTAWFTVYDLYGTIVDEWSVATVGASGNSFNDTPSIDHTIDYSLYSYLLNWRPQVLGPGMQVCGFRIFYQR